MEDITEDLDYTHFFASKYEPNNPTPDWDKLLKFQLSEGGVRMVHILIGKDFYELGKYDHWQVALFLLGDGNCGKSTVMHCVERMLPEGSVGTISRDVF